MSVLLDTNVVSELARPQPNPAVVRFCGNLRTSYLSVVTLHELVYGARLVKEKRRQRALLKWIGSLQANFSERIHVVTT